MWVTHGHRHTETGHGAGISFTAILEPIKKIGDSKCLSILFISAHPKPKASCLPEERDLGKVSEHTDGLPNQNDL
uniref:Uncharacterized protein n=1 Tax=Anguilla anguilla TaxID=7936 RepID=A0A0E9UFH6_ANGAN